MSKEGAPRPGLHLRQAREKDGEMRTALTTPLRRRTGSGGSMQTPARPAPRPPSESAASSGPSSRLDTWEGVTTFVFPCLDHPTPAGPQEALGRCRGPCRLCGLRSALGPLWALQQLGLMTQGNSLALGGSGTGLRGPATLPSSSGGCSAGSHSLAACRTSGAAGSCRKSSRGWL